MDPRKLATLRPGDVLDDVAAGIRFKVSTAPRPDATGNYSAWLQSGAMVARISVRDCGHYRIRRRNRNHGK